MRCKPTFVYADNNATTMVDPRVSECLGAYASKAYANPSSPYSFARLASAATAEARRRVARLLGAEAEEIIFTSGGSEANNTAIRAALAARRGPRRIVISAVEHSSVYSLVKSLAADGVDATMIPVDREGRLHWAKLEAALEAEPALLSLMLANNETGVIFPVARAAALARARGVLVHTDAVQAVGKVPVNVRELGVDYLSLSGHKFHAPKGCGCLYARRGAPYTPLIVGGEQERGRRAGTENVGGIVGLGLAAELAEADLDLAGAQMAVRRDSVQAALAEQLAGIEIVGRSQPRLPNTLSVMIEGVEADALIAWLDLRGLCVSSGSACAAGAHEPSRVLKSMGYAEARLRGVIRLSFSRFTTEAEVDYLVGQMVLGVNQLRRAGAAIPRSPPA